MRFISTPNLPESDVALSAVSGTYPAITDALRARKIDIIPVMPCKTLDAPVSDHADMLLHHLGGDRVVVAKGEETLKIRFEQYGFQAAYSNVCVESLYPQDVKLNCARIGRRQLIGNGKTMDVAIQEFCVCNQIELINVKQGYAKCSTVVVDSKSIITADPSIAAAATNAGIDVLKITPGYVNLEGYEYGFLGGTCGMIAKGKLAFTGSIQNHPDYNEIKNFCNYKNVELVSLVEGPLLDIGGILPLKTL